MTATVVSTELSPQSAPNWLVLAVVLGLHVLALWGITTFHQSPPGPDAGHTIRVRLIQAPPEPVAPKPEPKRKPEPKPEPKPKPEPVEPEKKPIITQAEPKPEPVETVPPPPEPEPAVQPKPSPPKPAPKPEPQPATSASAADKDKPAPVILPNIRAAYRNNPPPVYPRRSRRLGQEGKVLLRVHITPEGRVDQIKVKRSSGYERLDEAALETVRDWRFSPARQAGEPVAAWVLVPVHFELR